MAAGLPNLVIAGVGRAGTTSLFSYLAQHPEVCASSIKEVGYFAAVKRGGQLPPLDEYLKYFSHCELQRYRMEASPGYFYGGASLILAMKEALPGVRVVFSLRDPSTRFWSYFNYMKTRSRIENDTNLKEYLEEALNLQSQGIDQLEEHTSHWALSSGFYAKHLPGWSDAFENDLRVVFFEDLEHNPRAVVEELCGWLGIDTRATIGFDYAVQNRTVPHKSKRLRKLALRVNDRGEAAFRRHPRLKNALRAAYYRVNTADESMRVDPAVRAQLDRIYSASNEALATELLTRGYVRLPAWLRPTGSRTATG